MDRLYLVLSSILLILFSITLSAQTIQKQVKATRITSPPKIDGVLDEAIWKSAFALASANENVSVATEFIQFEPNPGNPSSQKTKVKVVYDNSAVYVGAMLFDSSPDSILKELGYRDVGENNADLFGVFFDTYDDDLNAFAFIVSASGVQTDLKYSSEGQDAVWDAVWESKANITDQGWIVELKIPYSAIRFPEKEVQIWGVNFFRVIRRYREKLFWNYVDPAVESFGYQFGELVGIKNIKPPLRLSFTPYISGYIEKNPESVDLCYTFNGGLDLKYGISESFTLDMTLIPDFGQVQSDDEILNLTPFETYYVEKRPFFTEGTELFNKGGIFYSKRIGSVPVGYNSIKDSLNAGVYEEIIENPGETKLINATKISGRTKKQLGIGFFNAMTSNTYATVIDTLSNKEREILTQAFTNYNLIVLDQSLKNNSFISFINTNVTRENYTANVSAGVFKFADKKNMYAINGKGALSQIYDNDSEPVLGHQYYLNAGKISGNFLFSLSHDVKSDKYNQNDMGYLEKNNEITNLLWVKYNIYKPFWKVLKWNNQINFLHSSLYEPNKFMIFRILFNSWTTFKNHLSVGIEPVICPVEKHDYFESRVPGRVFIKPKHFKIGGWISPDYRKKIVIDIDWGYWQSYSYFLDQINYWYGISPRIRISDRLSFYYNFKNDLYKNDLGWVNNEADTIYFGKRDINTITNTFSANYIFNNKSSLSFRLRHYWSKAEYDEFYLLQDDGYLDENTAYNNNHNVNYNAFTIDMAYTWYFAPGSEMSVVWKNAIYTEESEIIYHYFENLDNIINSPQTNSISLKILYYLDYQYLKKKG